MLKLENQTIIVPFDFSAPSQNAVNQVLDWANESNTIHVIHVTLPAPAMNVEAPVWLPANFDIEMRDNALESMKKEFKAIPSGRLLFHSVIGDAGTKIVELAEQEGADFVVMPSHGRSGISRLLLGSVAERVLRLSHCPVFILRGERFEKDDAKVNAATTCSS